MWGSFRGPERRGLPIRAVRPRGRNDATMRWSRAALLIASCGLSVGAVAQSDTTGELPAPERRDQAPAAPAAARARPVFPGGSAAGAGLPDVASIVQVNVDVSGMNIVGDAANEPSLAVDPRAPNRVAIGWRQFDTVASNFRQAGRGWSNDGGRTWHNAGVHTPGTFRSDPVLRAGPDGTIYYHTLQTDFDCDMFASTDGGRTWSGPTPVPGGDKVWMAIDSGVSSGRGNIYLAWNTAGNNFAPNTFVRAIDNEFDTPVTIPQTPIFGTLDVNRVGDVLVFGRNPGNASQFWVARSTNARNPAAPTVSFLAPAQVNMGGAQRVSAGPNPGGLLGQAWIGVDRSGGARDGWIYLLCSVDPAGADPLDVHFVRSTDGGQTWSAPVRVNTDPPGANSWQWFGTLGVSPDGRIDAVWNDTRESQAAGLSRLYYATSSDGGTTWTGEAPISPEFNSMVGFPQQNKLGDYYDIVSDRVGAHVAWAATFTGGQDVYYTRINDYDCNSNGVPDAMELGVGGATDCNGNGALDSCDIASGFSLDTNNNGVPDECDGPACPGDANGDLVVNFSDLNIVLGQFGQSGPVGSLEGDLNLDGVVDFEDLNLVLSFFGATC